MAEVASAYLELTKPRITLLVMLTSAAGYCMASNGNLDYLGLVNLSIGVGLLSSGISALNQCFERDLDGLMLRTRNRPLPAGKLTSLNATMFGWALSLSAIVFLAVSVNLLTAGLGTLTLAAYLFLYTPLKTRTSLSTVVGALPGAAPPLIGWTAARGEVSVEALILFAILFLWQFPHFLAIAWMYREDYARAGIKMLPVVEDDGHVTSKQILSYSLMLVPASLLPAAVSMSGEIYLYGALILGLIFVFFSVRAAVERSKWQARRLLLASVLYLPALFVLMVADH